MQCIIVFGKFDFSQFIFQAFMRNQRLTINGEVEVTNNKGAFIRTIKEY